MCTVKLPHMCFIIKRLSLRRLFFASQGNNSIFQELPRYLVRKHEIAKRHINISLLSAGVAAIVYLLWGKSFLFHIYRCQLMGHRIKIRIWAGDMDICALWHFTLNSLLKLDGLKQTGPAI